MTKAFVVGHPIRHSRSPLIHGHWLRHYGIDGSYERIDVAPVNFADFLRRFPADGYAGGNVTIPHKEAAYAGVERRTVRAQRLKAVNTLWLENGVLWGDNTDVLGFMAHLDASLGKSWERDVDTALVLGAGGAARAIVAGLQDRPLKRILVANRSRGKAEDLIRDLGNRYTSTTQPHPEERSVPKDEASPEITGPSFERPAARAPQDEGEGVRTSAARSGGQAVLEAIAWEDLGPALAGSRLIVNTTSLGMAGQPPLLLDLDGAPPDAVVADIVYVPLRTPLLAAAEERGLRCVDGLGMLLHQAAPGFERWFGVAPEVTPDLRALIAADIQGGS
jgi:shikimate dehydrogenase